MRSKLAGATDWTNFIVCPVTGNLLCEYTLISSTFTIKSVNTWGIGLISSNREGTKRYFHFDGVGSAVALTEDDGTVTDSYVYSAFGVTESSSVTSVNPFRYFGQFGYYDDGAMGSNSGLHLLGVRYYSPNFERFLSWDPFGGTNLYWYAGNSPLMAIDPTGCKVEICSRPVSKVCQATACGHWFLKTTKCGCIGYGPAGVILNCRDNLAGWDIGYMHCEDLELSSTIEDCLCEFGRNAKKGWTMCGTIWSGDNYRFIFNNCQKFVRCLLAKCLNPGSAA